MSFKNEAREAAGFSGVMIIILILLGLGGTAVGLFGKQLFGVWNANIDRQIFERSKSHIHGTIQTLNDYRYQFRTADPSHREALREVILHEYSAFKHREQLPNDIKDFVNSL